MLQIIPVQDQATGSFNNGQIIENKPVGFPQDGGVVRPFSSIFYWANAVAKVDSTIGLHPHQGFEIMSFVLEGSIKHYDTQQDAWKPLSAGGAQIIRAGSGISHSEFMAAGSRMFQIWLDPDLSKTITQPASYDDYEAGAFPITVEADLQRMHYAGGGGPMHIDSPGVRIERWQLSGNHQIVADASTSVAAYLIEGDVTADGTSLAIDDFMLVNDQSVQLSGSGDLFVITGPTDIGYKTYAQMMMRRR